MFRPGKPAYGPPLFGPAPPHCPALRARGFCGEPPPGHFLSGPCGPFVPPTPMSPFVHGRPAGGRFASPQCSSLSVDHSTPPASGSSQQMVCPAEPPDLQVPQWNHRPDNSDKAGEEFLRCIADNKPLPDYLKGNMAYNLADAIRTANALKEAVKSDVEFQKHITKHKSRSRSRSRRKPCAKSPVRSKSRARSRSKSRARSRSRARHQSCGKSRRAKSKSRARSRSPSQSQHKSCVRSKSQVRSRSPASGSDRSPGQLKKSQKRSVDVSSGNTFPRNSLLEGLKMVMNSRELEERLPSLKEAILTIQGSCESKNMACAPDQPRHEPPDSQEENDSTLLPHDRVGSDFSWLQVHRQENDTVHKADALEDEESFLYGGEDIRGQDASAICSWRSSFDHSGHEAKQAPPSGASGPARLDNSDYEKIKEILRSAGVANMSEAMVKMQAQPPVCFGSMPAPSLTNPHVRQALESVQCLIKARNDKWAETDASSQACDKHKSGENEERKQRKQTIICEMESLLKELDGLLEQDGLTFLTPVLGLYCEKCEEFFGDLNRAEKHAAIHWHHTSNNKVDNAGDSKGLSSYIGSSNQQPHLAAIGDHHHSNGDNQQDHRSIRSGTQDSIGFRKERMLITVSRWPAAPSVRGEEERSKENAAESHVKRQSSKERTNKDRSSDSSDSDPGNAPKKKKKKRKKKKKQKRSSS